MIDTATTRDVGRIAGFCDALRERPGAPVSAAIVSRMLAALAMPGSPSSVVTVPRIALGWRGEGGAGIARLGEVLVALDGRIYNRARLEPGLDDAALIARLYRERGMLGMLGELNGDFAIALWDGGCRTLWLARDRLGVRPLYHAETADGLAFASRPRSLLTVPAVPHDIDRRWTALYAGSHYRYFDNAPDRSPYAAIRQVPAGHVLCASPGGTIVRRYWAIDETPDVEGRESELAARYREVLLDAVAVRVRDGGRPAFTLSGGMDSSSVLAAAAHLAGEPQPAFSVVYDDPTYDESEDIRPMVDAGLVKWHPLRVGTPDVPALVRRMIDAHDEPVATATWLSHFLVCEAVAAEGFDVLLGGLGGDELNAGEYEYFPYFFADLAASGDTTRLDHEIACWVRHHDHPVFRKNVAVAREALARLVDRSRPGRCLPDRSRLGRYADAVAPEWCELTAFEPVMEQPFASYLKTRTWQDLTRETAPCCLRAEDRQTRAFGLTNALPFLDHRVVELMYRVPGVLKIRDGVTKHLLRAAVRGLVPDATRTRIKKTGWNAPAHRWFCGRGRETLLDIVGSRRFRERGLWNPERVRAIVEEHERIVTSGAPVDNHMMFLWQLLNVELWLEWLERDGTPAAAAADADPGAVERATAGGRSLR